MSELKQKEKAMDLVAQGMALMSQAKYKEANDVFLQAVAEDSMNPEYYVHLGNSEANLGEYDEAIKSFEKALLLDKKSVDALFGIGNVYFLKEDRVSAIEYYNRAEECGNLTSDMYEIMAGIFSAENDFNQALRCINKAIKASPLDARLYLSKVTYFMELDRPQQALETLKELNTLLPDTYESYSLLLEVYIQTKDFEEADKLIAKGVERFPTDENIAFLKIKLLVTEEKDAEALEYIDQLKTDGIIDATKDEVAMQEAYIYMRKADMNKAIEVLEAVCDENYSNVIIDFLLINAYAKISNYEKIEVISKEMQATDAENQDKFYYTSALFYHAESLLHINREEEAINEFKELKVKFRRSTINDPAFYEGYIYRVLVHKALKEYDEALKLCDYIEALYPEKTDAYSFRYAIYKEMGDGKQAEAQKAKVLEIDPNFQL